MLAIGTKAPDFTLPDQNGELRSLSDFKGKKVILYFYSKDMTSGCTKQALGFAELYDKFLENGAVVIGVSKDSAASHKRPNEIVIPLIVALSKGIFKAERAPTVIKVSAAVKARAMIVFFAVRNISHTASVKAIKVSKNAASIFLTAFSCSKPLS